MRADAGEFSFFQALRLLEGAARGDGKQTPPALGDRTRPRDETVRLTAAQGLYYPEAELESAASEDGRLALSVLLMGLTGPSGVLPAQYSSFALRRRRADDDSLIDFFDIFNHRALSLFYRAWKKYRPAVNAEENAANGRDAVSSVIAAACGLYGDSFEDRLSIRNVSIYAFAGRLSRRADSERLALIVSAATGLPAKIEPFAGGWITIEPEERTRLRAEGAGWSVLGQNAVLGERYWEVQRKFTIAIGPAPAEAFSELLPGGRLHRRAVDLVRLAVGPSLDFDFKVRLKRSDLPALRLGCEHARLGWSAWVPQGQTRERFVDAVLPSRWRGDADVAGAPS